MQARVCWLHDTCLGYTATLETISGVMKSDLFTENNGEDSSLGEFIMRMPVYERYVNF